MSNNNNYVQPYVSIDIETTGLEHDTAQVLEIGAVFDNGEADNVRDLPTLRILVHQNPIVGDPYALNMHPELIEEIAENTSRDMAPTGQIATVFHRWLHEQCGDEFGNLPTTLAGKNLSGFDLRFIGRLPGFDYSVGANLRVFTEEFGDHTFSSRVIDVGSLYYAAHRGVPSLKECKEIAGMSTTKIAHTAVEDAMDVVRLIRIHRLISNI